MQVSTNDPQKVFVVIESNDPSLKETYLLKRTVAYLASHFRIVVGSFL